MIERWGLETALRRANGMFAIGVWDRKTRISPFGPRPDGKEASLRRSDATCRGLCFRAKAIAAFPEFVPEINPHAVAEFLGRGWLPDDHCIWQGVFKLPPGSILSFGAADLPALRDAAALRKRANSWWSLIDVARKGRAEPVHADDGQLVSELDHLLRQAVGERMVADVPIGLFLSGGIDSSTVVALMQSQSTRPVRTFTIGFGERAFNEAANAAEVAQHLGTDHTELLLTPTEARAVIPELPQIWDEPFADESQIPALLLSRLARRDVTVALSGDGGDECFGGYSRHILTARLAPLLNSNRAVRRMAALGVTLLAAACGKASSTLCPLQTSSGGHRRRSR
jgi:asparagine synthase (glutamine-hydrolysing)